MPQQVTTTRNMALAYVLLGGMILVFTSVLFFITGLTVQAANLLWNSISAPGSIVGAQAVNCSTKGYSPGYNYTVQFTDRAGQVHLTTLHGYDVTVLNTPSFTIVYLANNPRTIDLPGALPMRLGLGLSLVIFFTIVDLLFIGLWIKVRRNQRDTIPKVV